MAPPAMPIDSRAVAEAPGGGQKDCVTDSVTWERSGPVRSAGHTSHECILIGKVGAKYELGAQLIDCAYTLASRPCPVSPASANAW